MVLSSQALFGRRDAPGIFLYRRIMRVAPLYWLATGAYFFLLWHVYGVAAEVIPRTIAGIFFIPLATENYSPLLPVGWTLNFEMLFYLMFAATLRFRKTIALASVTTAICILWMISFLLFKNPRENGFAAYVFNGTILDFVWGIACGYLYVGGYRLPRVLAAITFGVGLVAIGTVMEMTIRDTHREFLVGIPAAIVVFSSVCVPQIPSKNWFGKAVVLLGDSSYSLYLIHWVMFTALQNFAIPYLLAIAVVASIAVRILIEAPLLDFFRSRLGGAWHWELLGRMQKTPETIEAAVAVDAFSGLER
jgi:peptidoglycan/LPS O-acetylase OafA/YrhL